MKKKINILYLKFENKLDDDTYSIYFKILPEFLKKKNMKYIRWQDRHAHLYGVLLLLEAIKLYNLDTKIIENLTYNNYGKPFINDQIDFNISHSGEYVLCAVSEGVHLGIDIEKMKSIDLKCFASIMTKEQLNEILKSPNPNNAFYRLWTIKESIIKAEGRGMSIPMETIKLNNNSMTCEFERNIWFIKELSIDNNYAVSLAVNNDDYEVEFISKNLQLL